MPKPKPSFTSASARVFKTDADAMLRLAASEYADSVEDVIEGREKRNPGFRKLVEKELRKLRRRKK